jgi:transposase-like protein
MLQPGRYTSLGDLTITWQCQELAQQLGTSATLRYARYMSVGVPGNFCTSEKPKKLAREELVMARGKRYQPEQVVNLLRQIEVAVAKGKTTAQACKEAEIVEQTYFRWRKEYGGLQVDQAKRLKELEQENAKLKRFVAELSLDKLVLKDIASGNF